MQDKMMFRTTLLLLALFPWARIAALAPPHPDFTADDWNTLHEMRHRNNFTHGYKPSHISNFECSMSSEEDCRNNDEAAGLPDNPAERRLNPSIGSKIKVLVLLVKFKDEKNTNIPPKSHFEELFNGNGKSDINPAGSIRQYLRYSSLGKYNVQFVIRDWVDVPQTEKYYAKGVSGRIGNIPQQEMFADAMADIDVEFDLFDWFDYDTISNNGESGDGILDHLVVIHSSWGAELGGSGVCNANEQPDRIWSQGSAANNGDGIKLQSGNFLVGGYTIGSSMGARVCTPDPAGIGIITHEYLHGFKLVDLYDQDSDEGPVSIGGAGNYDIMANPYGWLVNPGIPGHMGPYSRIAAGWLNYIEIVEDGVYAIQPSEMSSQLYVIRQGFPDGEYLVIENRQKVKWDADWPANGLIIWHIDEAAPLQTRRSWPGKAGWPADHFRVAVLSPDGNYDLEKGNNLGDEGDFWVQGMTLGPSSNEWPNTMAYKNGNLLETGISLTVLSRPGFIMNFQVSGLSGSLSPGPPESAPESPNETDGVPALESADRAPDGPSTGRIITLLLSMMGGLTVVLGLMSFLL